MEVVLLMKGKGIDGRKEQEIQKWDDVYRNGCCEPGVWSNAIYFKLFCVCFYIRLFNTGKILLL